jgi:hypothetical protein
MRQRRSFLAILVVAAIGLGGCGSTPAEPPAAPEEAGVQGDNPLEVTVSEQAAERLGIETTQVAAGNGGRTSVPYAAILYDPEGATWVYTNPSERIYVRTPVKVEAIQGDTVTIATGPPAGTSIVTVGLAELYGAETGVGDPE